MADQTPADALGSALMSLFAAVDEVPHEARAAASAALGWRDVDAELAALTSDNLLESAGSTVRGPSAVGGTPHLLSFATRDITIDLEITEDDQTVRVLGQLTPAQTADVSIEYPGGRRAVETDEIGRFHVDGLPPGWLRVVVDSESRGVRSHTEWVRT